MSSRTAYRSDADAISDRIQQRLRERARHVAVYHDCDVCGDRWDTRTWEKCPRCETRKALAARKALLQLEDR